MFANPVLTLLTTKYGPVTREPARGASHAPDPLSASELPDIDDLTLSKRTRNILAGDLSGDRSDDLAYATRDIYSALPHIASGKRDEVVLALLVNNPVTYVIASSKRPRSDDTAAHEAAVEYLWTHHCLKQRHKLSVASADDFEEIEPPQSNVVPFGAFCGELVPPVYVWHRVLQLGCLYALTAKWGHGKTALMLTIALFIAAGRELCGRRVSKCRVLYLCGENPADVQLRVTALALHFDIPVETIAECIYFTRRPFAIDDRRALATFIDDAKRFGPFGLVVIDTGVAHSSAEEENDNREMHALAMAMRDLMLPLGNPATVALMHPTKEATRDNLQPRGGGAFSGSIDGELCAWHDKGIVEFFHRTKFRGPGFDPMVFKLEKFTLPELTDNFGEPVETVIAVESIEKMPTRRKPLSPSEQAALNALESALGDLARGVTPEGALLAELKREFADVPAVVVRVNDWRERSYAMGISEGNGDAKQKAFKRAWRSLINAGDVCTWQDWCWATSRTAQ